MDEAILLADVKNYLDITWETTAEEDKKILGFIKRGIATISGKIGTCDFEKETPERALLFDYCMYARSGALNEFWKNYSGEIVSLQIARWADAKNKK